MCKENDSNSTQNSMVSGLSMRNHFNMRIWRYIVEIARILKVLNGEVDKTQRDETRVSHEQ